MTVVFVFIICLAASTIGGICGIGGGVIIKPLLDAIGIMSVSTVSFLSGLTVLSMAVVNVWKSRNSGELDVNSSIPLGIGAAAGGIIGKLAFSAVKKAVGADSLVGAVQAIVLGLLVLGTLIYTVNRKRIRSKHIENKAVSCGIGLALGVCSSFLGIGGGPMNLAVLYYFFSMDTKKAAVNSILIILISQIASLILSIVTSAIPGDFLWINLVAMASAGVLGGFISARLHKQLSASLTDKLFLGLLTVILMICVYNAVRMLG